MTSRASTAVGANELQEALSDDDAFEAWYRRTVPRIYTYLMSRCGDVDVAEELTQLTYIAALDQRWRFDGRSDVVTWLCGIARHKLADHYRALERQERRAKKIQLGQIHMEPGTPAQAGLEERTLIVEAFQALPPTQRAMLAFVAQDGLSVAEAGRLLGKSVGAADSLLHRARESFRRAYRGAVE